MTYKGKLSGKEYPDHWDVYEREDKEGNIVAYITCSCGDSWSTTYYKDEEKEK